LYLELGDHDFTFFLVVVRVEQLHSFREVWWDHRFWSMH